MKKEFRNVQQRLSIYSDLETRSKAVLSHTNTIFTYLPSDTHLVSITANATEQRFQARGIALSELSIAQYIAGLKASGNFEEVNLTQAKSANDGIGVDFTLDAITGSNSKPKT